MGSSQFGAAIGWGASGLFLDSIELGDPADGLFGDGGALRPMDIDELGRTCAMQATSRMAPER